MIADGTGVAQRQQKHFRVTVPQAFSGIELVQWLLTHMAGVEDAQEAVHIANILAAHGYLFTVIDRDAPVRDDGTLYRFQLPYFWPSHSGQPDSIEYGECSIHGGMHCMHTVQQSTCAND